MSIQTIIEQILNDEFIKSEFEISFYGPDNEFIELESDNIFYIEMTEETSIVLDQYDTELHSTNLNDILNFIKDKNVSVIESRKHLNIGVEWDSNNNIGTNVDNLLDSLNSLKTEYPDSLNIIIAGGIDDDGENLCAYITRYETLEEKSIRVSKEQDNKSKKEQELLEAKERVRQLENQLGINL